MSIIDQARAVAERRYNADLTDPESARWRRDTRAAFEDGACWLLDQLTDPDQATVDAVAIQMCANERQIGIWRIFTDDEREDWRKDARAVLSALTSHLNGADHA